MGQTAVVSGAGSGVGRAVAIMLAQRQWNVALLGRQVEPLKETIQLAGSNPSNMAAFACDVAICQDVQQAHRQIEDRFGPAAALVASAGLNIPHRGWDVLTSEDFQLVVQTNLTGTFNCVQAVLPGMRARGRGTIVAIVSDAALAASPKAGAAYVASKFGQRGLVQSINAEERNHGIRATAILPGDIDTPLLDKRPTPPTREARQKMLQPQDVAQCVLLALELPQHAILEELLIRPR